MPRRGRQKFYIFNKLRKRWDDFNTADFQLFLATLSHTAPSCKARCDAANLLYVPADQQQPMAFAPSPLLRGTACPKSPNDGPAALCIEQFIPVHRSQFHISIESQMLFSHFH